MISKKMAERCAWARIVNTRAVGNGDYGCSNAGRDFVFKNPRPIETGISCIDYYICILEPEIITQWADI